MSTPFKRISISCLLVASLSVAGAGLVHAQERERRQEQQRQEQRGFDRGDAQRGNYQIHQQGPVNRLSPEERQALRRQINEAGQDIYVRPRR